MRTYSADYLKACRKSRANGMAWAVRIAYDGGTYLNFASFDVRSGFAYIGAVAEVSFSDIGFNPVSGKNINGSCTIRLANGEGAITSLVSGKNFLNRTCSVYRFVKESLGVFNPSSSATPISNGAEFVGTVTNFYYDIEGRSWIFELEHITEHRRLPQTIITKEDYPKAPNQVINAPIPILYGSFSMSSSGSRADEAHGLHNVAPLVCTDETLGVYTIANHACYAMSASGVAYFIDGLGEYGYQLRAYDGTGFHDPTVSTTGPATVTLPLPSNHRYWAARRVYLFPKIKGDYNQFSGDSANAVDGDYNTDITVGASTRYAIGFSGLGSAGLFRSTSVTTEVNVFVFVQAHSGSATPGGIYNPQLATAFSPSSSSGTGLITYPVGQATNRTDIDATPILGTAQWTFDEIGRNQFYVSVQPGSSQDISAMGVYLADFIISGDELFSSEIAQKSKRTYRQNRQHNITGQEIGGFIQETPLYGYYRNDELIERGPRAESRLFIEATGRKFGSWIGSRNGLSTSNYIATSNYIIESILRDELGVDGSWIDTTAFDNDYSDAYTMALSLNELRGSEEIIADLAYQSASYCFKRPSGKWTILRLPATPSSADANISFDDIKLKKLGATEQTGLINEITINYHYNYANDTYRDQYNAEDTTSKGSTSDGYNATRGNEITARFIRKSSDSGATDFAESLGDYILANWKDIHYIAEFDILNPKHFAVEAGDIITLDNVAENFAGIGTGSAGDYFSAFDSPRTIYWLIYKTQPMLDACSVSAIQLHDLS